MPTLSKEATNGRWVHVVFTWENVESYVTPSLLGIDGKIIVAGSRLSWFKLCHGDQVIPVIGLQLAINIKMLAVAPENSKFSHARVHVGPTG